MKKIVVCSKNKAKNAAVEAVMKEFFNDYELIPLKTESKVSETPIGDDEGLDGCHNRISDALSQIGDAYLYIAMEGILVPSKVGTFLCGWTVVYNKEEDEYYYGCSSKIKVDDKIIEKVDSCKRLSEVVAEFYNSTDEEISLIGTNGVLTHGVYTRTDEFVDSVKCAVASKFERLVD